MCTIARYITYPTNLSLLQKNRTTPVLTQSLMTSLFAILAVLLYVLVVAESPGNYFLLIFILPDLEYKYMFILALKFRKTLFHIFFAILSIYIFHLGTTTTACLCLLVFQNWWLSYAQNCPQWLLILLIILSNDIHQNPGPPLHNSFFNFMSWNVNSIAKDNFERVRLIEAHNSIYNYDLISICETSLNDSITGYTTN